jgi:hypothetical protein
MYHVNMLFRSSIKLFLFLVENQNHHYHYTIPVNSENEFVAFCVIFFFRLLPSLFHFLETGLYNIFMYGIFSLMIRIINLKS